uniref:Uncharacterized protein n=1 Tax=Skeletonema marinoi TaxID=267567 RepID=A0A6U3SYT1_9STRA
MAATSTPADLRLLMTTTTLRNQPSLYGLGNDDGDVEVLFCPEVVSSLPGQTASIHNSKLVAFHGEIIAGTATTSEITTNTHLALTPLQSCPTAADFVAYVQAEPAGTTGRLLMDPVDATAATVPAETRQRKLFPIPFGQAPSFLRRQGRDTKKVDVRIFFASLYPLLQTSGKENDCIPMINAFRQLGTRTIVGGTSSHMDTSAPPGLSRCPILLGRRLEVLHSFLPGLDPSNNQPPASSNVVREMELSRQQGFNFEKARREEREEEKLNKIRNKCGGTPALKALLQLCEVIATDQLTPTMQSILTADESQWDGILQAAFDELLVGERIKTKMVLANGLAKAIVRGDWATNTPGDLAGGSIANLFQVYQDQHTVRSANQLKGVARTGQVTMSVTELQTLIGLKVHLPFPTRTKQFIVVCKLLLQLVQGSNGSLFKFIEAHLKSYLANDDDFASQELLSPTDGPLRGVYHLMVLNNAMYSWTANVRMGNTPPALNPDWIFEQIDNQRPWQPMMNKNTRQDYHLDLFAAVVLKSNQGGGLTNPAAPHGVQTDLLRNQEEQTMGQEEHMPMNFANRDAASIVSHITTATRGRPNTAAGAIPLRVPIVAPGAPAGRERDPNPNHNNRLFQKFADMFQVSCGGLKKRIKDGSVPEVVESKVKQGGRPKGRMCLAFHVRGGCSKNCNNLYDHVAYSDAEYESSGLVGWCNENWKAPGAAE